MRRFHTKRWETCVAGSVKYFGAKVSQMYYSATEGADATLKATLDMVNDLKKAFAELIDDSQWMDSGALRMECAN